MVHNFTIKTSHGNLGTALCSEDFTEKQENYLIRAMLEMDALVDNA